MPFNLIIILVLPTRFQLCFIFPYNSIISLTTDQFCNKTINHHQSFLFNFQ